MNYNVYLIQTVSTVVQVDAEDIDDAVDQACQLAPSPTNSTNRGIDLSGEWQEVSVTDEDGEEVWQAENESALLATTQAQFDRALEALKAAGVSQAVLDAVVQG